MKKQILLGIALFAIMAGASATAVHADGCSLSYGSYGSTQNCTPGVQFSLNKQVEKPGTTTFVDNLTTLDPLYHANDTVNFQVTAQNTGSVPISSLQIADVLPSMLTYISGTNGSYNATTHTLTFSMNDLQPGKSQTVTVVTKVGNQSTFPQGQNVFCVNNLAQATDATGNTISDTAQLCIGTPQVKTPVKVTTTPATGPEDFVLPLLGSTGILGAFLKRKSK